MLLGSQKPDRWGFRLRAVIAADQKPSVVIQEVRSIIDWDKVGVEVPGVLVDVVKALAPKTLVLLAKENGDVPILGWTKDRNGVPLGPVMPVWGPVERVREWKEALMGLWEEEGVVIP